MGEATIKEGGFTYPEYQGEARRYFSEQKAVAQERTATANFKQTALLSASGHIAWDASANEVFKHVATENTILDNPTNMKAGAVYRFVFVQHATAAKTLGFGSAFKWPGGTAPTVSTGANAIDLLTFVCLDGTSLLGVADQAFSAPA